MAAGSLLATGGADLIHSATEPHPPRPQPGHAEQLGPVVDGEGRLSLLSSSRMCRGSGYGTAHGMCCPPAAYHQFTVHAHAQHTKIKRAFSSSLQSGTAAPCTWTTVPYSGEALSNEPQSGGALLELTELLMVLASMRRYDRGMLFSCTEWLAQAMYVPS